jgi:hypothetical protein
MQTHLNFFASWNDPGLLRTTIDRLLDRTFKERPCVKARLTKLFSHTRKKHSGDRTGWLGMEDSNRQMSF